MEWQDLFNLVVVVLLVIGNAFFVGSEIALTSARRSRINQLVETGNKAAMIVQTLHNQPERFYSVTQVGITLVSLGLGAVGIVTITGIMEPGIDYVAVHLSSLVPPKGAHAFAHTTAEIAAFVIISFLHIVGGELAPKVYAFHRAEAVSLAVGRIVNFLYRLFFGFIWVLNRSSNGLLWLLGQRDLAGPAGGHFSISEEELRTILAASEKEGILNPDETRMIRGVFELDEQVVRDLMVPRTSIIGMPMDTTVGGALAIFRENKHSRYPIYDGDIDHVVGFLPIKELLDSLGDVPSADTLNRPVSEIMLPPYIVPGAKMAGLLLQKFRQNRQQMAVVIDEFGGTDGLITLEDLLEEIVGEYEDEHTPTVPYVDYGDGSSTLIDGRIRLDDLEKELEFSFPPGDYVTLAGLVYQMLAKVPVVGDRVELPGCALEVITMENHRVAQIKMTFWKRGSEPAEDKDGLDAGESTESGEAT
jgi:CBS domain containing-hemolysin-like protein